MAHTPVYIEQRTFYFVHVHLQYLVRNRPLVALVGVYFIWCSTNVVVKWLRFVFTTRWCSVNHLIQFMLHSVSMVALFTAQYFVYYTCQLVYHRWVSDRDKRREQSIQKAPCLKTEWLHCMCAAVLLCVHVQHKGGHVSTQRSSLKWYD